MADQQPGAPILAVQAHDFAESGRPTKRLRLATPPLLTAAAAHADKRLKQQHPLAQTSTNPQTEVANALMGMNSATRAAVSTPQMSPAANLQQLNPPLLQTPNNSSTAFPSSGLTQTSPISMSSVGTPGPSPIQAGPVGSPQPMDHNSGRESLSPEDANKSMSYPVPGYLAPQADPSRRGMSLPHAGAHTQSNRSPSSKKHKCPFCSTEFTRHHNLKSHLLTHSHEKPYVCSTCNSRFRRLHDLKRHTKLHTGERPHVCPKCKRQFARGDALARHNKGPGGCAGQRASMGSFGGPDGDDGEDDMDAVVYDEPSDLQDEDGNFRSTPQIRRQAPSGDDLNENVHFHRMPTTYPPIQGRPTATFPPPSYSSTNPSYPSQPSQTMTSSTSSLRPTSGQLFNQNPMTESPKPLSPGRPAAGTLDSSREPSGAGSNGSNQYNQPYSRVSNLSIPQLPPPTGLPPPGSQYTLPSQPTHPPTGPTGPATSLGSGPLSNNSTTNTSSSHGTHGFSAGSGSGHKNAFPTNEERLWAYVRSMETNMAAMAETMKQLSEQVQVLTKRLDEKSTA